MKSYIRIEMPIKIEEQQFDRKISTLPEKQMYSEVYKILNIDALKKIAEKYKKEVNK